MLSVFGESYGIMKSEHKWHLYHCCRSRLITKDTPSSVNWLS